MLVSAICSIARNNIRLYSEIVAESKTLYWETLIKKRAKNYEYYNNASPNPTYNI